MKNMLKLLLFAVVVFFSTVVVIRYFSESHPIVNVRIEENSEKLTNLATKLNDEYGICPFSKPDHVIFFGSLTKDQNFIEWTTNKTYFSHLIESQTYHFYYWGVRFYEEGEECKSVFFFSPSIEPIGFRNVLPEKYFEELKTSKPIENVDEKEGKRIAMDIATHFNFSMVEFEFAVASEKKEPSGRIDRTYTFKKVLGKVPNLDHFSKEFFSAVENDLVLELKIGVSGNVVSSITLNLKPPEAFDTHYRDMRSYNDILSSVSSILMLVFSLIFFLKGMIFNVRRGAITKQHVKKSLLISCCICLFLNVIQGINTFPSIWIAYDPNLPKTQFVLMHILASVISVIVGFSLYFILILGVESMARYTFPNHLQFYKSLENLNTIESIHGIILAYLLTPVCFAYNVLFYLFFRNYMGWWTPTSPNLDPSLTLLTYQPWIASVSMSFAAGFLEELLFRVLLLSGFHWMSNSLQGSPKFEKYANIVRIFGFFIMCFSFSGAHANYPTQPFFGRLVELFPVSFLFGWLFLSYGFFPAFILHFLYDLVWFSISIFVSSSSSIWVSRIFVIVFAFLPLVLVGIRIYKSGVRNRDEEDLNRSEEMGIKMSGDEKLLREGDVFDDCKRKSGKIGLSLYWLMIIAFVLLFTLIAVSSSHYPNRLGNGTHSVVIKESRNELERILSQQLQQPQINPSNTISLDDLDDFYCFSRVIDLTNNENHIYTHLTPELSHEELLEGGYLLDVYFMVTCFRFGIKEHYLFRFDGNRIFSSRHVFSEDAFLPSLDKSEVETFSREFLEQNYGNDINMDDLVFVSQKADKKPNDRVDWSVVFNVTGNQREVKLSIQGDEVSEVKKSVFVPESFSLERQRRKMKIAIVGFLFNIPLIVYGLIGIVKLFLSFAKEERDYPTFKKMMYMMTFLNILSTLLGIPQVTSGFQPEETLWMQVFAQVVIPQCLTIVMTSLITAFAHSMIIYKKRRREQLRRAKTTKGYMSMISSGLILYCVSHLLSEVIFSKLLWGVFVEWTGLFSNARILDIPSTNGNYFVSLNSYFPGLMMGVDEAMKYFQGVGMLYMIVMNFDSSPYWSSLIVSFVEVFMVMLNSEIMGSFLLLLIIGIAYFVILFVMKMVLYRLFWENSLEMVRYQVLWGSLINLVIRQHSFSLVNFIVSGQVVIITAWLYERWIDFGLIVEREKED